MALMASSAWLERSATLFWVARDMARTRRPIIRMGMTTSGSIRNTYSVRRMLVMSSITKPPMNSSELRRNWLTELPTTFCSNVVSVVRRLSRSPVRVVSKNTVSIDRILAKTSRRMSATTRSPIHETRR